MNHFTTGWMFYLGLCHSCLLSFIYLKGFTVFFSCLGFFLLTHCAKFVFDGFLSSATLGTRCFRVEMKVKEIKQNFDNKSKRVFTPKLTCAQNINIWPVMDQTTWGHHSSCKRQTAHFALNCPFLYLNGVLFLCKWNWWFRASRSHFLLHFHNISPTWGIGLSLFLIRLISPALSTGSPQPPITPEFHHPCSPPALHLLISLAYTWTSLEFSFCQVICLLYMSSGLLHSHLKEIFKYWSCLAFSAFGLKC